MEPFTRFGMKPFTGVWDGAVWDGAVYGVWDGAVYKVLDGVVYLSG